MLKLKRYLEEVNISNKKLCKKANIADSTLSQFINEERKEIKFGTAIKISKALGISLDELSKLCKGEEYENKSNIAEWEKKDIH